MGKEVLGSIYCKTSEDFMRGLYPIAGAVKAEQHDLVVMEMIIDEQMEESQVLTPKRTEYGKAIRKAYESGEVSENRHNMTELRPREDGVSNTLTTSTKDNLVLEPTYRVRRLTPLECWRLMGFSDDDFKMAAEVNSNTQLYKQAGNSIVKDVLMAIFSQMM